MVPNLNELSKLKEAVFEKDASPMKLTDGKSVSFIATAFVFTEERNNLMILTEKGEKIPVTVSDGVDNQNYFVLLSMLTGKSLAFEKGVLTSLKSVEKPKIEAVVKDKAKTRSCGSPMLLNR